MARTKPKIVKMLTIRLEKGKTEITLEQGYDCAVINIGHLEPDHWIGACLTPHRAERIRDWLNEWLDARERRGSESCISDVLENSRKDK
jgi:hypothetical protein